jgi:hypothetical protein
MPITLDGNGDEEFWAFNDDKLMYIPIATSFGVPQVYVDENGTDHEIPYFIRLAVAQNATHIFFNIRLVDLRVEGSDTYNAAGADAFALLFNIDQEEFMLPDATPNFGPGNPWDNWMAMDGDNLGGGTQDLVFWQPSAAATGISDPLWNATSGEFDGKVPVPCSVWDKNYGWFAVEQQDWQAAAQHGYIGNHYEYDYSIEMMRPLITNDPGDVQFQYDGYFEFAAAYWNASKGAAHWVSFEHTMWVHGAHGASPGSEQTVTYIQTETETVADVTYTERVTYVETRTEEVTVTTEIVNSDDDTPNTPTDELNVSYDLFASVFGLMSIAFVAIIIRRKY